MPLGTAEMGPSLTGPCAEQASFTGQLVETWSGYFSLVGLLGLCMSYCVKLISTQSLSMLCPFQVLLHEKIQEVTSSGFP